MIWWEVVLEIAYILEFNTSYWVCGVACRLWWFWYPIFTMRVDVCALQSILKLTSILSRPQSWAHFATPNRAMILLWWYRNTKYCVGGSSVKNVAFQIGPEFPAYTRQILPFLVIHRHFELCRSDNALLRGWQGWLRGEYPFIHDIMHRFACNSGDPPSCLITDHTASNCYV